MNVMQYTVAFSRIKEPGLRRLLMGDETRNIEPITGITYVKRWEWDALREIAKRDGLRINMLIARIIRHYVISEGFNAPNYNPPGNQGGDADALPKRQGLIMRLFDKVKQR